MTFPVMVCSLPRPALTPANVDSAHFGKLFTFPVDSYLFAQPLYAGGIGMPDGAVHNLLFAAVPPRALSTPSTPTETILLPGISGRSGLSRPAAGSQSPPTTSAAPTRRKPASSEPPSSIAPPGTLYVVVKSVTNDGVSFSHYLHALSLIDGSEQPNSPSLINPTFSTNGQGVGAVGNLLPWDGQTENQRSALLLAPDGHGGKTVWISYASHCDQGFYHGVIVGYNASNVGQLTATFNNTPNGNDGGIWMGAGGPAADASGKTSTRSPGTETFDADSGGPDYGDAITKLTAPRTWLQQHFRGGRQLFHPQQPGLPAGQ